MKLLRRLMGRNNVGSLGVATDAVTPMSLLHHLSSYDNLISLSVIPITNGFLICRRVYNSQGPDMIEATYSQTAEDLGPQLVAKMAATRITK
jgi:hypothetical protein